MCSCFHPSFANFAQVDLVAPSTVMPAKGNPATGVPDGQCCQCTGNSKCGKDCCCREAGKLCEDCGPGNRARCRNSQTIAARASPVGFRTIRYIPAAASPTRRPTTLGEAHVSQQSAQDSPPLDKFHTDGQGQGLDSTKQVSDSQQLAWDALEQLHVAELCVDGQDQGLDGTTQVSASQQLVWDTLEQRHLADPISNSQKVAWDLLDASTPTPSVTGYCGEVARPHEANAPWQDRLPTAQEVALLTSLSSSQPNSNSEPEPINAHALGTASGQGAATPPIPPADQRLRLGELSPEDTGQVIAAAYEEIVHFRPNLFSIPSGAHGRSVVDLSARYLNMLVRSGPVNRDLGGSVHIWGDNVPE